MDFTATNDPAADQPGPSSPTRVADIKSSKLVPLSAHHTFGQAVQLMTDSPFRHFLVIHADGRLAGVFSDRDVLRALGRTHNWQAKNVSGVMRHKVFTVTPETPLSVAAAVMLSRRINCLPVVGSNGKVCGIITSTDLLRSYQKIQHWKIIRSAEVQVLCDFNERLIFIDRFRLRRSRYE